MRIRGNWILLTLAGLAASATATAEPPSVPVPRFVEPGPESGLTGITAAAPIPWDYVIDTIGTGVALFDYDLDGDLDIYQVQASALKGFPGQDEPTDYFYRNDGHGRFEDVTRQVGLGAPNWGQGVIAQDYDNDGDTDLFVTAYGPARLYRNEGNGTFTEVGAEAGLQGGGWSTGSAFFDYDKDGLLDLYVARYVAFDTTKVPPRGGVPGHPCTYREKPIVCGPLGLEGAPDTLYRNNGDGTFSDVSAIAGTTAAKPVFGLGVITGDVDSDGDEDLFVANDTEASFLFMNEGNGKFTEDGVLRGVAYKGDGRVQASMGVAFGDPDGDQDLDLYITHFSSDYSTLYVNDGSGFFEDRTIHAGLAVPTIPFVAWATAFDDFDNDGDEDIFATNGHTYPEADTLNIGSTFLERSQLFLNDGTGKFTELMGEAAGPALAHDGAHRGAAFGDIDEDGDIDVITTRMFERLGFYRNDLPPGNHWIAVRLYGTHSNRDAIGTRIRVHAGGKVWLEEKHGGGTFQSANDPRLHVGIGAATRVEKIEILWPSGASEQHGPAPADQTLVFIEPDGGPEKAPRAASFGGS